MNTSRNLFSVLVAASFIFVSTAQAQDRVMASPENPYANPVTTTTLPKTSTIQSEGKGSSGKNMVGVLLGVGAAGFCAINIPKNCFSTPPNVAMCALYTAGLAASIMVTANMMKAKKKSDDTVNAVTVAGNGADSNGYAGLPPSLNNSPDWQAAQETLATLKSKGWNINTTTGVVTDPTGKSYTSDQFGSSAAMSAAGYSSGQIAALSAAQKGIGQAAEAKVKSADGSDMFGEDIGASAKAGSPAGSSADGSSLGSGSVNIAATQGLGINRDPAQVAGMTKNLGGEPIGVSADSLFKMIDRRYDLHKEKGSFLTGP